MIVETAIANSIIKGAVFMGIIIISPKGIKSIITILDNRAKKIKELEKEISYIIIKNQDLFQFISFLLLCDYFSLKNI